MPGENAARYEQQSAVQETNPAYDEAMRATEGWKAEGALLNRELSQLEEGTAEYDQKLAELNQADDAISQWEAIAKERAPKGPEAPEARTEKLKVAAEKRGAAPEKEAGEPKEILEARKLQEQLAYEVNLNSAASAEENRFAANPSMRFMAEKISRQRADNLAATKKKLESISRVIQNFESGLMAKAA